LSNRNLSISTEKSSPFGGGGGLYIHIPFCKQACHYCDFHFSTSLSKKKEMLAALKKELELRKKEFGDEIVETIYFGGGTPSILDVAEINDLIETIYTNFQVGEEPEITLEANPDDLVQRSASLRSHAERSRSAAEGLGGSIFKDYQKAGINRLSIGIQSFFEEDLKWMNRAHNAQEAEYCIESAIEHFDNISIDLIYGIPGMSNERWMANIERTLSYGIPHISSYALTVEPKTALANFIQKGISKPVDDEAAQAHFNKLYTVLTNKGYECYEVSNFGKPGFYSKNNTAYWQGKKYMGIGPSAHSFDGYQRSWNINNNPKYIRAIQRNELPNEVEVLSETDRYNEYVMTGLRTIWGVSFCKIEKEFGLGFSDYLKKRSKKYLEKELLFVRDGDLIATQKGKFLIDGIASDLFVLKME